MVWVLGRVGLGCQGGLTGWGINIVGGVESPGDPYNFTPYLTMSPLCGSNR